MQTILVTGSAGFIGKHLVEALWRRQDTHVIPFDLDTPSENLEHGLHEADVIYHLAGVNRPQKVDEFKTGNADFTASICASLSALGRNPIIVLSSSVQVELDNPYGLSKRQAEESLRRWEEEGGQRAEGTGHNTSPRLSPQGGEGEQKSEAVGGGRRAVIFRLKNVFGKWCRPNYNSVTATFCHNIAHDLPITISDPGKELELLYIDDVVAAFLSVLDGPKVRGQRPEASNTEYREVPRSFKVTLGELAARIRSFRDSRTNLVMPLLDDALTRCLYATYLSYLDGADFGYKLEIKTDNRGCLAEFMKSAQFGHIFVSRTKPGITRGNHYHHTKTEKFLVVEGEASIRFRKIVSEELGAAAAKPPSEPRIPNLEHPNPHFKLPTSNSVVIEHRVSGRDFKVLDIPPGYTHSIENVGPTEMVVLFWASEVFDPSKPDTYVMEVKP